MSDLLTVIFVLIVFAFIGVLGILSVALGPWVLDSLADIQNEFKKLKKK